jgi:hypothetical protein
VIAGLKDDATKNLKMRVELGVKMKAMVAQWRQTSLMEPVEQCRVLC